MTKNLRLIFFIAIGVVIVAGLILILVFGGKKETTQKTNTNQTAAPSLLTNVPTSAEELPTKVGVNANLPAELSPEQKVKSLASNFVERYGSYSNQGNLENLEELQPQMTATMKAAASSYRTEREKEFAGQSGYYGLTTTVLITKLKSFSDDQGEATLLLATQRVKETAGKEAEKSTQNVTVTLKKVTDQWLVDSVVWQ